MKGKVCILEHKHFLFSHLKKKNIRLRHTVQILYLEKVKIVLVPDTFTPFLLLQLIHVLPIFSCFKKSSTYVKNISNEYCSYLEIKKALVTSTLNSTKNRYF